jgi:hypothetical protein
MPKKMTTADFVTKAVAKHGDKWDYTNTEYFGNDKQVAIHCRVHGVFHQLANDHLSKGAGCPDCAGVKRMTTEQFIVRGNKVHGTYNYSKVKYRNTDTKVCIVCKNGHEFWQTPHDHLQGAGCPHCAGLVPITESEFLKRAPSVHGDDYGYSLIKYVDYTKTKVEIICKKHNKSFWQTPQSHLEGRGCPICGGVKMMTDSDFVDRAIKKHGTTYGYDRSRYAGKMVPLEIHCKTHGYFWQMPIHHLSGAGCQKCADIRFDPEGSAVLYVLEISEKYAGFGITNNFTTRIGAHKTTFKKAGVRHSVVATFESIGREVRRVESAIKQSFNIMDAGVDGFRTEAVVIDDLPKLMDFINDSLNK